MRPTGLHVYLDEPGGGASHVDALTDALDPWIDSPSLALSPARLRSPAGLASSVARTRHAMDRCAADFVHAHGTRVAACVSIAARSSNRQAVGTVHGLHWIRRSQNAASVWGTRLTLRSMAAVITLSPSDRELIARLRLAKPDRVHGMRPLFKRPAAFPRSEARRLLGLPPDAFVLLWIGRLSEEKDPMTLLSVAEELEDVHTLIVGDGPLRECLQRVLGSDEARRRTTFVGWMDEVEIPYAAADAYISTSLWEAMPVAALEAASTGLPLVVRDAPGNRDLAEWVPDVQVVGTADLVRAVRDLTRVSGSDRDERSTRLAQDLPVTAPIDDLLTVYRGLGLV